MDRDMDHTGRSDTRRMNGKAGRASGSPLRRRAVVAGLLGAAAGQALSLWSGLLASGPARAAEHAAPALQEGDVLQPAARAPGELSPLVTSNEAFYYVTKNALNDPVIPAA